MSKRKSGVLLHISSLPSPFGLGVLGKEAFDFIDKLERMNFSVWQVLPLGHTDLAGSPYCSASAFAGNPAFIDPRELMKQGLISHEECFKNEYFGSPYRADFEFSVTARLRTLRLAFSRLNDEIKEQIELFKEQNKWVVPYAEYMSLKEKNDKKAWWDWTDKLADKSETDFYVFVQYEFFIQWRTLKEYANSKGIEILGDMPIYVSLDSVDVWANPEQFLLDSQTMKPTEVAGVPPDYFSQDGQLWGNPLYNWDLMEKNGYEWWLSRLAHSAKLFDIVRIDHFRAFASYWAVPAQSTTAKTGEWKDGPGMKLFNVVKEKLPKLSIVAEDLGTFGQDVIDLLDESGFPGMRVIQFGFDPNGDSTHLPHNYPKNCVAYVGTHDNNTILGWLWEASEAERAYTLRYCRFGGNNWGDGGAWSGSCRAVIETVWTSSADTAIVAFQDMAGFGRDARMNTPGTSDDNWTFRATEQTLGGIDEAYYKEINHIYRR